MNEDIVTRLRQFGDSYGLDAEAADEIERLRAEIIDALNNAGAWKVGTPFGTPISKESAKEILEALRKAEEAQK